MNRYSESQTKSAYRSPVYNVRAVPVEKVVANSYNPNVVAPPEMKLLELSIWEDGYTMPCVCYYDGHHIGVLYFRILVAVSESQQQTVCPRLVHDTNLGDDRLIVVAVMETPVPFLFGISTVAVIGLYLVVIVRIVLVGIQLHGKSVFCRIAETYIGFMGVE